MAITFKSTQTGVRKVQPKIAGGTHMVGIYGDNWLNKTAFELSLYPAPKRSTTDAEVAHNSILESDEEIMKFREEVLCSMGITK